MSNAQFAAPPSFVELATLSGRRFAVPAAVALTAVIAFACGRLSQGGSGSAGFAPLAGIAPSALPAVGRLGQRQAWEYTMLGDKNVWGDVTTRESALNAAGAEGWIVVAVYGDGTTLAMRPVD